MRSTFRLLAKVKAGRYLEPNTPTGLTGLFTHPSPRPHLIVLYNQTLAKLKQFPESSVYRQSAEALTKHRLKIISETKPAGYEEWLAKVKKVVEKDAASYEHLKQPDGSYAPKYRLADYRVEWDGEKKVRLAEGPQTSAELAKKAERFVEAENSSVDVGKEQLEVEPPLDADQISEIESKIGAGLIEEVIQVAEGELELVDEMLKSKVWEPLEEKAPEGQWSYFERGTHTATPGGAPGPKTQ
ncbi:putative nadh-ubiquinone oxidoreductase 299 kda [Phaeomoniella chlamydospora]|uniref:Putative nadh-ubiquinone oxidoreductase 299 kDa n=1 Tax=Phaeomoniella chlamydospora TaxID=158046 RepID=A0A0G2EA39_PHACM|nr:putative nadh-ubiquinone oxidoreductase 299 kda [Phaeomoniella chlamydospora]